MTTREFGDVTLERVREHVWEIPREGEMEVPGRVLASEALLEDIGDDDSLKQLKNAAALPGMTKYALAMPDAHQGYGFPVGGVGAIDAEDGCISPGAVGFDINCGVRMLRTPLRYDDVRGREEELVEALFDAVPSGLGGGGV
ncbi:RtcB family protein, partial [Halolamina salina]|uniref:RtcB family protein n=1 Tax=Halolamina salina TaxID=1220023 RepID=UPI003607FD87